MKKLVTGRNHLYSTAAYILMTAKINGNPTKEKINEALQKTVCEHEIFATKIITDKEGNAFYQKTNKESLNVQYLNKDPNIELFLNEQIKIPFNFGQGNLSRFFIVRSLDGINLIIVAHHLLGDGLSLTYFIRDFMENLENTELEKPQKPLMTMEDFGFPTDSNLKFPISLLPNIFNKAWVKNKKIFTYDEYLKMYLKYWKNNDAGLMIKELPEDYYSGLMKVCKKHGLSVNSVVSTAIAKTFRESGLGFAVNIRPDNFEGMGNYVSGIALRFTYKNKKTFWKNAEIIHNKIYKRLNNNHRKYIILRFLEKLDPSLTDSVYFSKYGGFKNKVSNLAARLFRYNGNKGPAIGITNLGAISIKKNYGNYKIDSIAFMPPLLPFNKLVFGIVSINKKMILSIQYIKGKLKEYSNWFSSVIDLLKDISKERI